MKKRFPVEQIVTVLQHAELGLSVADLKRTNSAWAPGFWCDRAQLSQVIGAGVMFSPAFQGRVPAIHMIECRHRGEE